MTLSNLHVANQSGTGAAIRDEGAELALDGMFVANESSSGHNGVEATHSGSLAVNGGKIEMENGALGYGVSAVEAIAALNGVQIDVGFAAEDESGGVSSEKSGLSVQDTSAIIASGLGSKQQGIYATGDGSVSLQNDTVRQNSRSAGVQLTESTGSGNGVTVLMENASDKNQGVAVGGLANSETFDHLTVSGTWEGVAFAAIGGNTTIADSHLTPSHNVPAVEYISAGENRGLLVERSVLRSPANGLLGTIAVANGNVTVDSSDILGGSKGIYLINESGTHTLTVSGSTIDAGAAGIAGDASTVRGVEVLAKGTSSTGNAVIQGSVVLEPQTAIAEGAGDQANVNCTYTATPSQTQAAKGTEGAIGCAAGVNGNTNSSGELSTLFSEPLANYLLGPTSSAINSVPATAISLPFGIAPSSTDLSGAPRTRMAEIGGACVARQDKGAIESLLNPAPCPSPSPAKPVVGSITKLSISPNAFSAAPSGATVSRKKKAKKKYGATVSYKDSQVAITKFTVMQATARRTQGKTCKKPSKKNKHGKRCTLYKARGSFTRVDVAGLNKFHFSGRLNGQKLAKGTYKLQAVPHNAAGNGRAVSKQFKIK